MSTHTELERVDQPIVASIVQEAEPIPTPTQDLLQPSQEVPQLLPLPKLFYYLLLAPYFINLLLKKPLRSPSLQLHTQKTLIKKLHKLLDHLQCIDF